MGGKMKKQEKDKCSVSKAKIVVNRTFGTANLLELYSEYVAKKICEEMKNNWKDCIFDKTGKALYNRFIT